MKSSSSESVVPSQHAGSFTSTRVHRKLKSSADARALFLRSRKRLRNINHWKEYCGKASAGFTLTDHSGKKIYTIPQVGNYIKIELPAPESKEGHGYEWVKIELIDSETTEEYDRYSIKVRPASNPQNSNKTTAHFYTDDATSSFIIERKGNKVTASEYGRNELPNTETKNSKSKLRNLVVAIGAQMGLAHIQWKKLLKGILTD